MGAADRNRPRRATRRAGAGVNRFHQGRVGAKRYPLGATTDDAAPDQPQRRRADDPEQRRATGHQCQVDGEFVAAGDEFLGTVERIDQEEAVLKGQPRLSGALLGKRGYVRGQPRQAFGDDAVGREIGLRYRRSVALAVDLHGGTVDGQNCGAGRHHQVGQRFDQGGSGLAIADKRMCLIHERRPFAVRPPPLRSPRAGSMRLRSVSSQLACVIRNCPRLQRFSRNI